MKTTIDVTGAWTRVGDAWWVSDPSLATQPPPASEAALVAILREKGDAASILVLDDAVLLYAGQFYGGALFYANRDGEVTVADDITRLTTGGYRLDPAAIADYVFAKAFYFNQTPFSGVFKASPGCICRVTERGAAEEYLHLIRPGSTECTEERFLGLFREKLGRVAGKSVVATLSGGLDSSFVAGFIRRHVPCDLEGFHIYCTEGDPANRELEHARLLAGSLGVPLTEIDFTGERLIETYPHFCRLSPLPFPNSGYRYYLLHRYGGRSGAADYFVSGDASDTLFELSPDFYLFNKIHLLDRWLPRDLFEGLDRAVDRARPALGLAESVRWRLNHYLDFRLRLFHWKGTGVDYNGAWRSLFTGAESSHSLVNLIEERGMYDLDNRLYLLNTYFSYLELPIFVPLVTGLFGAKYYTPFLDKDVIELALNLPSGKTRAKGFLKELAAPFIPPEIITRKKMGLVIPFRKWLEGPMRPLARTLLLGKGGMIERGIVDPDGLTALVDGFFDGREGFGWCEVMALLALEVWLGVHMDSPADARDYEMVSLRDLVAARQGAWA